ncbi:hypothetical protein I7I48_03958 [Histoplasma ohiense]|nr:hypothetical protein I7I48_03958 [Histoplasma ohiense (nom. inval.)]
MSEIILTLFLTHVFLGRSSDVVVGVAGWEMVGLRMIYLRATLYASIDDGCAGMRCWDLSTGLERGCNADEAQVIHREPISGLLFEGEPPSRRSVKPQ